MESFIEGMNFASKVSGREMERAKIHLENSVKAKAAAIAAEKHPTHPVLHAFAMFYFPNSM
ncbi:MAG: hypothetical protein IJ678_09255 [Kiritimatiellae bacterium]|nr:hypothetical protein [Kiritimatiellia bacterium]